LTVQVNEIVISCIEEKYDIDSLLLKHFQKYYIPLCLIHKWSERNDAFLKQNLLNCIKQPIQI
uniref:DUF2779 domain-containing protein n=1 Tax=Schistosoma curassoni TaxID=6186 RepID=A0A183KER1_9TREM